jgi:hypothetical protein
MSQYAGILFLFMLYLHVDVDIETVRPGPNTAGTSKLFLTEPGSPQMLHQCSK